MLFARHAEGTYGTGCFALLNTGAAPVASRHRLLTTIAYRLAGKTTYALEGSIFVAGAAVQWLRDGLKLISHAGESELLAAGIYDTGGVYLVPAFVGLGAPHWDPMRAAILGLTRDSGIPQIVRAALESVGYQTSDLMNAMQADLGGEAGAGTPLDARRASACASMAAWSRTTGCASSWRTSSICRWSGRWSPRPRRSAPLSGRPRGRALSSLEAVAAWRCARRFEPTWRRASAPGCTAAGHAVPARARGR